MGPSPQMRKRQIESDARYLPARQVRRGTIPFGRVFQPAGAVHTCLRGFTPSRALLTPAFGVHALGLDTDTPMRGAVDTGARMRGGRVYEGEPCGLDGGRAVGVGK